MTAPLDSGPQAFLDAFAAVATADGRITVAEAESIRAIADALECPIPPLLEHT